MSKGSKKPRAMEKRLWAVPDTASLTVRRRPVGKIPNHVAVCVPLSPSSTGIASCPTCRGVVANRRSGTLGNTRRRRREWLPVPHAIHRRPGSSSDSQRCPFIVLRHMWHTGWALDKPLKMLTMSGWNVHAPLMQRRSASADRGPGAAPNGALPPACHSTSAAERRSRDARQDTARSPRPHRPA